jgi:hypothetical protein
MIDTLAWSVGQCANCLNPLDPNEVKGSAAPFCSGHCRKQAESVRYLRGIIRDGRSADPMTATVAFNNMVVFLALDLAYTRPRIEGKLRADVLKRNGGLCVECSTSPATEVDHVQGGSEDPDNLRGLCRACHEGKQRGPIPDDLTRDGAGAVDGAAGIDDMVGCWRRALYSATPLSSDDPSWGELGELARRSGSGRFGWVTGQILAAQPLSPAHDELTWRERWRAVGADYHSWASQAVSE